MTNLRQTLQRVNKDTLELDDAVELATLAETLRDGYKRRQMPSPEWLDDSLRVLDRYISDKTRDKLEMELRELAQADAADMSASERREARKLRRTELEAALGKTTTA